MKTPWRWLDSWRDVHVLFTGKEEASSSQDVHDDLVVPEKAWMDQIHSADVLEAQAAGCAGPGDALLADRADLTLVVVTADCVPVLLANEEQIAAVHAGWRGVAAQVVAAAIQRFQKLPRVAWIGPAISGKSYEVSHEVATAVVAVSGEEVLKPGQGERPHVDLQQAVDLQLRRAGIEDVRCLDSCTYQRSDILWSYRRSGSEAGRNRSMIWRQPRTARAT